jgi:hypothetical protein
MGVGLNSTCVLFELVEGSVGVAMDRYIDFVIKSLAS